MNWKLRLKMRINIPLKAFSVNQYYTVYRGMKNISSKGRKWRNAVLQHIATNYPDLKVTNKKLSVIYDFGFKSYNPDWDNYIKSLQDTLEGIIWENDRNIVHGEVNKFINQECDFITVEWRELDEEEERFYLNT